MQKSHTSTCLSAPSPASDTHAVRRENLLRLLREFSQARIAGGEATNGTEKAFAEQLQMSKSLLSQLKTSRPISDGNAKQIEARCKKPAGWLSIERDDLAQPPAPGEEAFIAAARAAYRASSRAERTSLRRQFASQP